MGKVKAVVNGTRSFTTCGSPVLASIDGFGGAHMGSITDGASLCEGPS